MIRNYIWRAFCTDNKSRFRELYLKATDAFRAGDLALAADCNAKALVFAEQSPQLVGWKDIAAVNLNQAHILKLSADFEAALSRASLGLAALEAHFSSHKREVCHALSVVAELNCELGNFQEALKQIDRAIEIESRISGPLTASLAKAYNISGAVALNETLTGRAMSDFIMALGINVRLHGRQRPLSLAIGITLSNIGNALRREGGREADCAAIYKEVLDSFENGEQKESWMVGSALCDLAESLIALKTHAGIEEAKILLTRALHNFLATRDVNHPSTERAAHLLKSISNVSYVPTDETTQLPPNGFVDTLLNECESVVPQPEGRVSGDILFLDRRGHVGHGHPHTRLF